MRRICKHVLLVLPLVWAMAGNASAQTLPLSTDGGGESPGCAAISAGLRKLEASAHSALVEVQDHRRQAEQHADWFGAEPFGAYIAALREQERMLDAALREIVSLQCPQVPPPPANVGR